LTNEGVVYFRYRGSDGAWFDEPDVDEITEFDCIMPIATRARTTTPAQPRAVRAPMIRRLPRMAIPTAQLCPP